MRTASPLFFGAWAAFTILYFFKRSVEPLVGPVDVVARVAVIGIALWTLHRPSSGRRVASLLAGHVFLLLLWSPYMSNSWLLAGLVSFGLLVAFAIERVKKGGEPDPVAIFESHRTFLRGALLLLYAFAVLAKLNRGYLDPETSCAGRFVNSITFGLFTPEWAKVVGSMHRSSSRPASRCS